MIPYVSITDFRTPDQVSAMAKVFRDLGGTRTRRVLAVGCMMSYKTLTGLPTKWAGRFPQNEELPSIFDRARDESHTLGVLHYADYTGTDVRASLTRALEVADLPQALQLDMVWPKPDDLPRIPIILQVNSVALAQCNNDPVKVAERLASYDGTSVEMVLLDKSMGQGKGMDAQALLPFVKAIRSKHPFLGLAAAGGLGPATMHLCRPLLEAVPDLSVDAQGQLRPSGSALEEDLDWSRCRAYLDQALTLIAKVTGDGKKS